MPKLIVVTRDGEEREIDGEAGLSEPIGDHRPRDPRSRDQDPLLGPVEGR